MGKALKKALQRILELEEENRLLRAYSQKLERQIAVLEEALRMKRKPPVPQDGGGPLPPPSSSGRKRPKRRGRKKGHEGCTRKAPLEPDRIEELFLGRCPNCETGLPDPFGYRDHIVEELPRDIRLEVVAYRHYRYSCPGCGRVVEAGPHRDEPAHGRLGLSVLLFAADLKCRLGIPYRKIGEVLRTLGSITISAGALQQGLIRLSRFFRSTYVDLMERLKEEKVLYVDETGWKVDGLRWWLWVFTNARITLFQASPSRSRAVPAALLKENFTGTVVADFYGAYRHLPGKAQKCLAHFFRELSVCAARGHPAFLRFRDRVTRILKEAIALRSRREKLSARAYQRRVRKIRLRLAWCRRGSSKDPDVERLKDRMAIFKDEILTFLEEQEVEPTNNRAERALRPAVVARKISGGNRTEKGAEAHAVLMSIIQTCRQNGTNIIDFGKDLLAARNTGKTEPNLLFG